VEAAKEVVWGSRCALNLHKRSEPRMRMMWLIMWPVRIVRCMLSPVDRPAVTY